MRKPLLALFLLATGALNATAQATKVAYFFLMENGYGPFYDYLIYATGSDATTLATSITASLDACSYSVTGTVFAISCHPGPNFRFNPAALGYTEVTSNLVTFTQATLTLGGSTTSASVGVSAVPIESWTVSSSDSWLTLVNSRGTGNVTVALSCSVNPSSLPRTATLSVNDATGLTFGFLSPQQIVVTQVGATPTFAFSSPSASVGAQAGSGTVALTVTPSDTRWTAASNQSWLTVNPAGGIGSQTIAYSYPPNTSLSPQTATITIGGVSFTVTQPGAVTLSPSSVTAPQSGGSGGVALTTNPATPWTAASNNADWLTVTPASGIGNATLTYRFAANNTPSSRTGTIAVNGILFTVNQTGIVITFSPSAMTIAGAGASGTVAMSLSVASTSWTATSSASWLTVYPTNGAGNAVLTYTVAPNSSVAGRSAYIAVNGTQFTIFQNGLPGSVLISPVSVTTQQGAGSGTITVTPIPSDYTGWTVTGAPGWLTLTFSENSVVWAAAANNTGLNRLAILNVGGQTFTLIQTAIGATNPVISGVTSAASYAVGSVAPGEIIAVFGVVLGPSAPSGLLLTSNGTVATTNSQTQVLFDGIPAPIISAFATQTSVQVPYGIANKATTILQVLYNGVSSAQVPLVVTGSAFGLFTHDSSGSGQGAVLNQDLSLNSFSNPAARGTVVVLYGTGEGQTNPTGSEGTISPLVPPWLVPVLPVSVTIGGQPAVVDFVGEAPGEVSGLSQINVTVPASAPSGVLVPVVVTFGTAGTNGISSSQAGVTIAVK